MSLPHPDPGLEPGAGPVAASGVERGAAGTAARVPASPRTRFVLVGTSHAGNVGAAARALKVMGFGDLVLVAPRRPGLHREAEAIALASGATDVLAGLRVVASLDEALSGIAHVCATAMTPRDFGPPVAPPREHFASIADRVDSVALVFGSERFGLSNEDVYRSHACLSIPTAPDYGSLNLAQAVQLVAYDWRCALGGFEVVARTKPERTADAVAVAGLLAHWQQVLVDAGFLDPAAPKKLMPRLHRLANRAELTVEEVHILRGIARALGPRANAGSSRQRDDADDPLRDAQQPEGAATADKRA